MTALEIEQGNRLTALMAELKAQGDVIAMKRVNAAWCDGEFAMALVIGEQALAMAAEQKANPGRCGGATTTEWQPKAVAESEKPRAETKPKAQAPTDTGAMWAEGERPIHALDAIYEQPGLTTADVAVYGYLWRRAGKKMVCWPGQEKIGRACHMKRDTVKWCLDRLKELGAVSWVRVGKPTGGSYNRYTLQPPSAWARRGNAPLEG